MSEIQLRPQIDEELVTALRVGDELLISGLVYTARDRAHRYLIEEVNPEDLAFHLQGGVIYHCGPLVRKEHDGWRVVSAGPTTSSRMNPWTPQLLSKYGPRVILGKGGMNQTVGEALQAQKAVYCGLVGGAAVVLARAVRRVRNVYMLEDFGSPEAIWEFEVERLSALVTMDAHGGNLHADVKARSRAAYQRILG